MVLALALQAARADDPASGAPAEIAAALADGRGGRARWVAAQWLADAPSDAARWVVLASTTDDPREALPLLDEALLLHPGDPTATIARARTWAAVGRRDEAVGALTTPPFAGDTDALVALADVLGDPAPARRALAAHPGDPRAALAVSRWTRDPAEARAALDTVSAPDRRTLAARVDRAVRDGDAATARGALDGLAALAPDGPETRSLARWVGCLEQGSADALAIGALLDARRAALVAPGSAVDVDRLVAAAAGCPAANALAATLAPDAAARVDALRAAVALAPTDADLLRRLGEALLDAKRPADARPVLERAHELDPAALPLGLARAVAALGDDERARALLDTAALAHPDDVALAAVRADLAVDRVGALAILVDVLQRASDPRLLARARELADALDQADALAPVLRGPPRVATSSDASEVVVVVGKTSDARLKELVAAIHALGYRGTPTHQADGDLHFVAEEVDRPAITLHPDGTIEVQKAGLVPVKRDPDAVTPLGKKTQMVMRVASARKMGQPRDRLLEALQPTLTAWREALCAEGLEDRLLYEIPATLDQVWRDGVARDGGDLLTPEARRADLLDWWVTRTCTPEGLAVRQLIAGYLDEVVQASQWPVTDAEVDATNARRMCDDPLVLR